MTEHTNESTQFSNWQKYTNNKLEDNAEQQKKYNLLLRATQEEKVFRFIFIQHNLYTTIQAVETLFKEKYPNRKILRIRSQEENYSSLTEKIYSHQGFILLEDFQYLVNNPKLANGFNQRRDRISQLPIHLICFLPLGQKPLKDCSEKIKDFWSIRNLILEFEEEYSKEEILNGIPKDQTIYQIFLNTLEDEKELNRILKRIDELKVSSQNYQEVHTLFNQATNLAQNSSKFQEGLEIAKQWEYFNSRHNPKQVIYCLICQSTFLIHLGELKKAESILNKLQNVNPPDISPKESAILNFNLGRIFQEYGEYSSSLKKYKHALNFVSETDDIENIANTLLQIGNIYFLTKKNDKAYKKYQESLKLFEQTNDIYGIINSIGSIGNLYYGIGDFEKALANFESILQLSKLTGSSSQIVTSLHSIGNVKFKQGDFNKAISFYQQSIQILTKTGNIVQIGISLAQIGASNFYLKNWELALKNLLKSLYFFDRNNSSNASFAKNYINQIQDKLDEEAFQKLYKKVQKQIDSEEKKDEI